LNRFTAMEEKEAKTVRVKTDTDEFILCGRPCELSAFSYIAPNRHLPKERTYFNVEKKVILSLSYGQTTGPADPAMRGEGRGPMGAQNYGIMALIFSLKI